MREQRSGVRIVGRRSNTPSGNPRWRITLDNGLILDTADDIADAYDITTSWADHAMTYTLSDRGEILTARRGEGLPPICQCCGGDGRHAYRATALGVSPFDDDAECTTCNESGRTYHHARPDSCGGAKAMRRARRA